MNCYVHPDDPWTWVAEDQGKVVCRVLAAPLHNGIVLLERLISDGATGPTGTRLINLCLSDCQKRGYRSYVTFMDMTHEPERKLMSLLRKKYGCAVLLSPFVVAAGNLAGKLSEEQIRCLQS